MQLWLWLLSLYCMPIEPLNARQPMMIILRNQAQIKKKLFDSFVHYSYTLDQSSRLKHSIHWINDMIHYYALEIQKKISTEIRNFPPFTNRIVNILMAKPLRITVTHKEQLDRDITRSAMHELTCYKMQVRYDARCRLNKCIHLKLKMLLRAPKTNGKCIFGLWKDCTK